MTSQDYSTMIVVVAIMVVKIMNLSYLYTYCFNNYNFDTICKSQYVIRRPLARARGGGAKGRTSEELGHASLWVSKVAAPI